MRITLGTLRKIITEALDQELSDQIEELMLEPYTSSVESFVEFKLENEETDFTPAELQAIAKNIWLEDGGDERGIVPARYVKIVKTELIDGYGMKFVPREPIRKTRGFNSSYHGTHPFAGSGAGGSGFGTSFDGPSFTSFGGGPGAIGGGYKWDPDDPKNLSMGSKRKK